MCSPLTIRRTFGYKEAVIDMDGMTNYCWHLNGSQAYNEPIKFELWKKPAAEFTISGLELYLTDYLSLALKASFNFVNITLYPNRKVSPETGLYNIIMGDVFATSKAPWAIAPPFSEIIRPITSPFMEAEPMVILSLRKPISLSGGSVISIFDVKTYTYVFGCCLLISTFLRFCRQDTKICRRNFLRQLFEILLLISLQPRSFGLIRERKVAIRIVIMAMIFTGLLMRTNFKAKLNSLFAFRAHCFVQNLEESLESNEEIKEIFTNSFVGMVSLREELGIKKYNILYRDKKDTSSDRVMKAILDNEAILVGGLGDLDLITTTYPFLPLEISEIETSATNYIWPIPLSCRRFKEIYFRLHLAYDHGIYHFAKRETEANERYDNDNVMQRLQQLYENSKYYNESSSNASADKVVKLTLLVLVIGCSVSTLFLLHEKGKYKFQTKKTKKAKQQAIQSKSSIESKSGEN